MSAATARRASAQVLAGVLAGALAASCGSTVSPGPSQSLVPSGGPSATPSTTPAASSATAEPPLFPLAVIASFTDLRVTIGEDALTRGVASGDITVPCGLDSVQLGDQALAPPNPAACLPPDEIVKRVRARSGSLGLVPAGAVSPAVKVLRIGDADLFGSPSRRAEPYPLFAVGALEPDLVAYDPDDVRTLITPLNWCPDRGVAQQVAKVGEGWGWVLDGGTARYTGTHIDTTFSGRGGTSGWTVVDAVPGKDHGAVLALMKDADVTIADVRCPIVKNYTPAVGHSTVFSLSPEIVPLLEEASVDVVGLASNHLFDHGSLGVRRTIEYLDGADLPHTGAGMNLAEALEPATVSVRGLRFGFVSFDGTIGSPRAGLATPGTADLSLANMREAVAKAKAAGADVIVALPVWNWPEYYAHFTQASLKARDELFDLGVAAILGDGTHWAGALSLDQGPDGPRLAVATHGNFLFDQDWSRETQEGVMYELTFSGRRLVQVRLHPYIILSHGQPNLTDPRTDGAFVLKQVFDASLFDLP